MEKWIFVNNITSLDKLYLLTKTVHDNNITEDNHARLLMDALNANGANRNEANNHPINYVLFYNMVYFDGYTYKLTENGIKLLNEYNKIVADKKYRAEFFYCILNKIEYPNVAVETSDIYKVHPFNIIFKLLCENKLGNYITIEEFESILSMAQRDSDYEKLVDTILKYRRGELVELDCEKIAQVSTVVAGWCNQFNVMKKEGEKIMISDDLKSMLPILSNEKIVNVLPYSSEFISFVLKKYLFNGYSMDSIESEFYKNENRRGFLAKDVLDYFQINNKDNKSLYSGKSIDFVCSLLDVQSDIRYKSLSKALRGEQVLSSLESDSILDQFINYYNENIDIIKEKKEIVSPELKQEFFNEYSLDKLRLLKLEEYSMGLDDDSTFCRKVEGGKYRDFGVKCSGDPNGACHWGIYFSREKQAYLDTYYNVIDNPNEYWSQFKNELCDFLLNLNNDNPSFSDSYPMLKNMSKTLPKLCFMYHTDKFLNFVTKEKLQELYKVFGLDYTVSTPADRLSYELNSYIRSNVPNAAYENPEYISELLWDFKEKLLNTNQVTDDDEEDEELDINDEGRLIGGFNKIYYGVPGCGKSFTVDKEFSENEYYIKTTTFHPEYTNSDFVGQIIPNVKENGGIEYKFHPGAFTLALEYALKNKDKKVCLKIEEINRGNASAIFGDIFQLLDRINDIKKHPNEIGKSRFHIFNGPIIDYLKTQKIKNIDRIYIPSNMYIVATMNTSDQNVFTLDTAFKRRWKMEYIKNEFGFGVESDELKNRIIKSNDKKYKDVKWETFVKKINKHIVEDKSGINGEDKQMGMYFVTVEEINDPKEFAEKILSYLWEDVAKINPTYWFGSISSYDELIEAYNSSYLDIFNNLFEDEIRVDEETVIKTVGE